MQSISQNAYQTTAALTGMCAGLVTQVGSAMLRSLARRDTRLIVRNLSDAQLCDAGIDRGFVLGNRPVINVDAELALWLASLR